MMIGNTLQTNGTVAHVVAPMRCILLAGGLRPSPLAAGAGMSALWLYPTAEVSVLGNWASRLGMLAEMVKSHSGHTGKSVRGDARDSRRAERECHCGGDGDAAPASIRVCAVFDNPRDAPKGLERAGDVCLRFQCESAAYRGPAGVVRDVAYTFEDDCTVLIAEANRWLGTSLAPMFAEHVERDADVTVARHEDGSPGGVYLARKAALDLVNEKGFVDLKEQWLATLQRSGRSVFVHTLANPGATPMRTLRDVLALARLLSDAGAGASDRAARPIVAAASVTESEKWSVVSSRAEVAPTAVVLGSVVMPGASVGAGAVVVRSVVCPGASVGEGAETVDEIVPGDPAAAANMFRHEEANR